MSLIKNPYQIQDSNISFASEDQLSRIVKKVRREKQNEKDNEIWDDYCQQTVLSPITGSYVVRDSYPPIVLPKNSSYNSLLKSGALTIISSETQTNTSSCTTVSYSEDAIHLDATKSEENGIVLELNEVSEHQSLNDYEIKIESSPDDQIVDNKSVDNEMDQENTSENTYRENTQITKLRTLRKKINLALDAIKVNWDLIPNPDGKDDLIRKKKRAAEFANRFSRNYLYDLGRQMTELRKTLKLISPRANGKHNQNQSLCQKLSNAHNIILQGLKAYNKHMHSSVPGGVPDKLQELLQHACEVWRMCNKNEILKPVLYSPGRNEVFIEDIDTKCKMLLQKIRATENNAFCKKNVPVENNLQTGIVAKKVPAKSKNRLGKPEKLSNRLSMYSIDAIIVPKHQQPLWKKSMAHLNKPKPAPSKPKEVKSKKKEVENIPLEPVVKQPIVSQENITLQKKISEIVVVPPREDDIVTQMEILSKKRSVLNLDKQSFDDKMAGNEITKENFYQSLRPLLVEILQNIDNENENDEESLNELKTILTEIKQVTVSEQCNFEKKSGSRTTSVGPQNAKLICLSPVDSNENLSEPKQQNASTNTSALDLNTFNEQCDTEMGKKSTPDLNTRLSTSQSEKQCRRPKQGHADKRLIKCSIPSSVIRTVTKYKDQYLNYIKKNNMYVVKTNKKPWEIVSRISDTILDEILLDVTKEVEIDQYLYKLYELEFK